jgi:hypothetical protein
MDHKIEPDRLNGQSKTENSSHILLLRWDDSNVDSFVDLFEKKGFTVINNICSLEDIDTHSFGAIVHLARSADALEAHLGEEIEGVDTEEWFLIGNDEGADDYHCTVQLTERASPELRAYIRQLWSVCSIV